MRVQQARFLPLQRMLLLKDERKIFNFFRVQCKAGKDIKKGGTKLLLLRVNETRNW